MTGNRGSGANTSSQHGSHYEKVTDDEASSDEDRFAEIPALRGFLKGARVTVSNPRNSKQPSEQTSQLWKHARSFGPTGGWKSVKVNRVTSTYTSLETATAFAAQSRHPAFPLDDKPVVEVLRARGVRTVFSLDDILTLANSQALAREKALETVTFLGSLGFSLNWVKSDLSPSQRFTYLGM